MTVYLLFSRLTTDKMLLGVFDTETKAMQAVPDAGTLWIRLPNTEPAVTRNHRMPYEIWEVEVQ